MIRQFTVTQAIRASKLLRGFTQYERFGKDTPEKLNNNVLTYELILQQSGNFSTIPSNQKEAF